MRSLNLEFIKDFSKRFVPQQELSNEQALWLLAILQILTNSLLLPIIIRLPGTFLRYTDALTEGNGGGYATSLHPCECELSHAV
ncbi:hypothetical protein Tco_0903640 [Tanacetum coccineum]